MQHILAILASVTTVTGAAGGTISLVQAVGGYLRHRAREQKRADILKFLHDLGCVSDAEVRDMVDRWDAPPTVTAADKEQLRVLLTNLVHGARLHSTNGTPVSGYIHCGRLMEQLIQDIQPRRRSGERLPGGWVLTQFLGMGSFGEVWAGEHHLHPERRAFKFFTTPGAGELFEREGRTLFAVQRDLRSSPNVIRYLDVAGDANPYPYLVLEYVGGGSLEDWLLTRPDERRALDVPGTVAGIARGLALAHRHGICHRDLKPANVLLTEGEDPVPKIADFGLGRVGPEAAAGSAASTQWVVVGTRMFLPPEAADPYRERHPVQDDVFAVGVIWYQLLTGQLERPPYDFADRLHQAGADARSVRLVSRCLAHPDRRYHDAVELAADIDRDVAPGPGAWSVPEGGFEVAPVAREYVERLVSGT